MAGSKKNYEALRFCINLCLLLIIFNNRILSLSSCSSGNYVAIDNGTHFTMERNDKQQRVQSKLPLKLLAKPNIKDEDRTVVVLATGHGSAGVSLATVLALLAGADHGGSIHVASVGILHKMLVRARFIYVL